VIIVFLGISRLNVGKGRPAWPPLLSDQETYFQSINLSTVLKVLFSVGELWSSSGIRSETTRKSFIKRVDRGLAGRKRGKSGQGTVR